MTFPPFKTSRRLAAFVVLAAVALAAAAHLLVGWLWPAEEEARELRERLRAVGIGLSWEGAGRDLAFSLLLDGAELGPLAVGRMALGADRLALVGVRLEPDGLGLIAEILAALDKRRLALEGELELGMNLTLAGGWSGSLADGRLTLAGEAVLRCRGREVELASTVYHTGGATHLALESEGSLVFGRLGPGAFLFSPRLEAAELTGRPRSTLYRHLKQLREMQWIRVDQAGRRLIIRPIVARSAEPANGQATSMVHPAEEPVPNEDLLQALTEIGVENPKRDQLACRDIDPLWVHAWHRWARHPHRKSLTNPIGNIILACQIAGKPWWWVFLFLIPIANIVFAILVMWKICEARNKPGWLAILMIVPVANLIIFGILAFTD